MTTSCSVGVHTYTHCTHSQPRRMQIHIAKIPALVISKEWEGEKNFTHGFIYISIGWFFFFKTRLWVQCWTFKIKNSRKGQRLISELKSRWENLQKNILSRRLCLRAFYFKPSSFCFFSSVSCQQLGGCLRTLFVYILKFYLCTSSLKETNTTHIALQE